MHPRLVAAALTLLSIATSAVPAHAEKPARIRVALVLQTKADNARRERWLLDGIETELKRSRVDVVEAAASPDATIDIAYRLVQEGTAAPWAYVVAKLDGRELNGTVRGEGNDGEQRSRWWYAGTQLGRDIVVVLALRKQSKDPASIDALLAQLSGRYPAQRAQAADRIARLGPQGRVAIPGLLEMLKDDTPLRTVGPGVATTPARVAANALIALGAHAELIAFFRSKVDDDVRVRALTAIAVGRSAESPEVILQALDDRSRVVRTRAAGMAGAYVGRRAAPKLLEMLGPETDAQVRTAARESLTLLAGKDLGPDAAAWRQWWGTQPARP
jgi:hypothetical protein